MTARSPGALSAKRAIRIAGWALLFAGPFAVGLGIRAIASRHQTSLEEASIREPSDRLVPISAGVGRDGQSLLPQASNAVRIDSGVSARAEPDLGAQSESDEARLRAALTRDSNDARALEALADTLSSQQSNEEAHAIAERCLTADATNRSCAVVLVRSDMREGHFSAARDEVDVCLRLDPRPPECVIALARLRLVGRDVQGAVAMFQSLGDAGSSLDREALVADIARERGLTEEAREHYRAACDQGQAYACAQLAHVGEGDASR